MARAYGRSVETEHRLTIARMRRANGAIHLTPSGELPTTPPGRVMRVGRAGAVVLEFALLVLLGIGLSATALHVVRPESSCASCSAERK